MADHEILYQTDCSELKSTDRNMRILRAAGIFLLDIMILYGILFVQFLVFGVGGFLIPIVVFLALSVTVIPAPILTIPTRYRVLLSGVDSDGKRLVPLKSNYRIRVNQKRKFVSVMHPTRGEFMRLYSGEPRKLELAVQKVISRR
ncbi:DUF2208 family protein [Candidatus Bathyarchaeota archaeon]|nr:DUF2208 family protein [Candidatus Bathyarchaeota archaeon]